MEREGCIYNGRMNFETNELAEMLKLTALLRDNNLTSMLVSSNLQTLNFLQDKEKKNQLLTLGFGPD